MQLLYPFFYKQYGLRRVQSMITPRPMTLLALPRDAVVHYYSLDAEHHDYDTSKLYLDASLKRAIIDTPTELTSTKGSPRAKAILLRPLLKDFLNTNKKFRYVVDAFSKGVEPLTLLVENYSFLDQAYVYAKISMAPYYRWFNAHKTIFDNIAKMSQGSAKNHFFFTNLPAEFPGPTLLNMCSGPVTLSILKVFDSPEKLFMREIWNWLSGTSEDSDNIFSGLKTENYPYVNIVFNAKDGRSVVLNLGYLRSWIKGNDNLTEFKTVTQITAMQMQKVFLKFLLSLQSVVTDQELSVEPVETAPVKTDEQDRQENQDILEEQAEFNEIHDTSENDTVPEGEYTDNVISSSKQMSRQAIVATDVDEETIDEDAGIDDQLKNIDSEIEVLEKMTQRQLKMQGFRMDSDQQIVEENIVKNGMPLHEIQQLIYNDVTPEQSLKRSVEDYADYGLLSASDYRNLMRDIEVSQTRKDPYGSDKSVEEARRITADDVKLDDERTKIVASPMVQDQSMLHSSLQSFDHDYIKGVMHKDVLNMLNSVQRAGIVVRKHNIEVDHSALGSYENHEIEIRPVDGQVSTIRFRLPKVDEDGTFVAASNKYSLRKQRVDCPIRKINPTSVALTSYYGKTFVSMNTKKANSSLEWIIKELNIASMSDHPYIKQVAPAKVFDNNFEAPYIYNALADNFKSVTTTKCTLVFDHTERKNIVDEARLPILETGGSRVIGYTVRKDPIIVDRDNQFYVVDKDNAKHPAGNIYQVLELTEENAPVDFTEVKVYSKSVPVAIVLGYTLGFENLLKFLQVQYRVIGPEVTSREEKRVRPDEFIVRFKDNAYYFSKKHRAASLILAGFLEFEKQLRQFEVEDFNHKDIYLNLLESKGLGSVYIREMEMQQSLFVDPITKEILQEMKEPVTFNGLLVRSTELLLTYHHPDPQDMRYMRVRGYERFAGAVYKEIATSIRQYKQRNIAGKSRVEMSPYQVWSKIMKDPALKLVEDINPIQNLKESEIVTYVGEGGRSKDSMSKPTRAYHPSDMGVVSEATVDSSDVGVNAYLSANPKFKNLRGQIVTDNKKIGPSSLVSTSALMAPCSDKDDQHLN